MIHKPTIYVASAGTGKTTTLLEALAVALDTTEPQNIIFTTFTNAGAQEIVSRTIDKFPKWEPEDFRYFRTMHSMAYRNIQRKNMLNMGDYFRLASEIGLPISGSGLVGDGSFSQGMQLGDHLLYLDNLRRNRLWSFRDAVEAQQITEFSEKELQEFAKYYDEFKQRTGKYDFTDQLEVFFRNIDNWNPPITHLFVDECQDLSTLQWAIVDKLHGKVGASVYAGDDKQAIYSFSGGDPETLINLEGERVVLNTSYRLPRAVLGYSESLASKISKKQPYTVTSFKGEGSVTYVDNLHHLEEQMKEGTWFLLVRNRKFMPTMEYQMNQLGFLYLSDSNNSLVTEEHITVLREWEDMRKGYAISGKIAKLIYSKYLRGKTVAHGFKKVLMNISDDESVDRETLRTEYGLLKWDEWQDTLALSEAVLEALTLLKENGELDKPPRIRLSTIHAVKGKEADNVVILPDMANLSHREFLKAPDDEHRVFYVAATRAKENLYLLNPTTERSYPL